MMMQTVLFLALLPLLLWFSWTRWQRFRAVSLPMRGKLFSYRALAAGIALTQLDLALLFNIDPSFPLVLGIMGLTTLIILCLEKLARAA